MSRSDHKGEGVVGSERLGVASHVAYSDLPTLAGTGRPHAWGQYVAGDRLGSLNRLTPERVLAALSSVRTGMVFPLDLGVGEIEPPLFDRPPVQHRIVQTGRNFFEDKLDDFYLQASSQWDGLGHVRYNQHGFWQGRHSVPESGDALGIDALAEHGIVGRGVLLDVMAYREADGRPIRHGTNDVLTARDLAETAERSGVAIRPGDIICVRTGWLAWYRGLDEAGREALAREVVSPGLQGADDLVAMLWDWQVAAITADNPAIEPAPGDAALHKRLIPLLGLVMGELFDFEGLAAAAAADGHSDFLFVSAPLKIAGGLGSPANALAVR